MSAILVGLIGTAVTAGISIYNGVDQNRKAKAARNQATNLLSEAKKNLSKNAYEELSVNLKASERSRDQLRSMQAQGGLGTFDQRMSPGQRALDSLMKAEQGIQQSEISQEAKIEKMVADEETASQDAIASLEVGGAKQATESAAGLQAGAQAAFTQAGLTTAAGIGTAIGASARSKRPMNQSLRGLDRSSSGKVGNVKFDYGDANTMASRLHTNAASGNFDWTTNSALDQYTSGIQQGFQSKIANNPGFQASWDKLYAGGNPTSKEFNQFMSTEFLPYEIQAMYK